jgi:predicted helicase
MPRAEVTRHMLQSNLALCIGRAGQVVGLEHGWNLVMCARSIIDLNLFYRGGSQNFPLYIYPELNKSKRGSGITMMLFEPEASYRAGQKIPNIAPILLETLRTIYQRQPSPEDIFNYIYGVLYSNAYRKKYAEFLKTDFPRVPFTNVYKLFQKLAKKGEQLIELHLLKSKKLDKPIAKCEGSGDLRVVKVSFDEKKKRVHINPDKYFTGIPSEVWEYHIGGYQVAEKWLKDRKGRMLSSEEITIYANVITAIAETIRIQKSLDDLFKEVETNLLEISL